MFALTWRGGSGDGCGGWLGPRGAGSCRQDEEECNTTHEALVAATSPAGKLAPAARHR